MTLFATMSASQIGSLRSELAGYDPKTALAYLHVCSQLRLRGTLPDDDRYLATLAGCTRRFWREHAKPLLADLFVFLAAEPGAKFGRLYHPEIERVEREPRPALRVVPQAISEIRQRAANERWRPSRGGSGDAPDMQTVMQTPMQTDAQVAVISTVGASGSDANLHAVAPDLARDSLSPVLPSEVREEKKEGEGVDARAGASTPADATGHAKRDAKRPARPAPHPLPADFEPPGDVIAEIELKGRDPRPITAEFMAHYTGKGELRSDWSAAYRLWWLRQHKFDAMQPQVPLLRSIPGGSAAAAVQPDPAADAAAAAAEEAACTGTDLPAQSARVARSMRRRLGAAEFQAWLGDMVVLGIEEDVLTIGFPTPFLRDHARAAHLIDLCSLWRAENPAIVRLEARVTPKLAAAGE